ncbi:MAG: PD40 domain-containing protein [Flavobacteriales bacterium]|nr:PD40 domain-containing protein [Flavobacteriales bacterium]
MKKLLVYSLFFIFCLGSKNVSASLILRKDTTKSDVYYFVSNRSNEKGEYTMYKARTNHSGISSCLIKGNFEVEGFKHMRKAEISVYNISNDELVGIYNTNPVTGNYLVILAPNVKYEFVVNTYGYAPIKKIVEVPSFASTNVLEDVSTQKISLKMGDENVSLSLNTWIEEEKEPTLFLLTVYNEDEEESHSVELYQAEEGESIEKLDRRKLKETDFGNIDELIKSHAEAESKKPELAEKAFLKKEYQIAISIYSQLLKLDGDDPVYNYRKGVALFYTNQNKLKALPFLKKAATAIETPYDVYYLMAKSYHLWADFSNAQVAYEKFKSKASEKEVKDLNINRLIENCINGKKLMGEQLDMRIVNKTPLFIEKLPKGYPSALVADKLMKKTKFFISPVDEKKKAKLLMFKTERNEMIQTSYGLNDENGKDLYANMLIGGDKWGIPKPLGENINTPYDEEYAYVSLNGRTLYFSSKGHSSIGGYDIFVSTRKSTTSPWGKPKNVGYPINSPYDDILFMPDLTGKMAYFSSNRRSPTGGYNFYEIEMPKPPLPLTIIKGHFMTTDSIPNYTASIAVYNTNNQEIVGIYNTNVNNGNFLMALMPGIKYEYILECDGFKEHTAFITVPEQTEIFALRQNIRLKKEDAFEILKVDNFFTKQEADNAPEYKLSKKDFEVEKKEEKTRKKLTEILAESRKLSTEQLQIIASAEQFFVNKQYLKSAKQFEKIAAVTSLNSKQSYYYGKALFNVSKEYEKTLVHLEKAGTDKNTPYEVYYMLGKTNHYAYRFQRAVKAYEKYKQFASEKEIANKSIEVDIKLSKFGKKLVNEPKPIEVISKKEFKKEHLHTIYNSLELRSKFLLAPDDMVSVKDRKENFKPTMYLNSSKSLIYYSSYGMDGANGKDIFIMRKLPNKTWTDPINLGDLINTKGDEDYPYLTEDGKTLYFCSTKHGSMGGYDICKATWNERKNKWNAPVNMGAPINSPFDDLFFVE